MEVRVNGLAGWVVTDDRVPTFCIRLANDERLDQVRLTVSEADGGLLWDTGVVSFDDSYIDYAGPALTPRAVLAVKVEGYA